MRTKTQRHLFHYLFLLIFSLLAISAIIYLPNQKIVKSSIIVLFSLIYFLWGIFHHTIESDIHPEIVMEYLLFALLGAGSVLAVLYYL